LISKQPAVDKLVKHGFFANIPGVGLVATSKYDAFGGYTDSYYEHAKEDAGSSSTVNSECGKKLQSCYKDCGPDLMRASAKGKSLSQLSSKEYWCRLCWPVEDRCK